MTQLQYYTTILKSVALLTAWGIGVAGILAIGITSYYLAPWLKK
jgi:hypothetical protein